VAQACRVGMLHEKFESTRITHAKCSLHLTITYNSRVKHVSSVLKIVDTYVRNTDTSLWYQTVCLLQMKLLFMRVYIRRTSNWSNTRNYFLKCVHPHSWNNWVHKASFLVQIQWLNTTYTTVNRMNNGWMVTGNK